MRCPAIMEAVGKGEKAFLRANIYANEEDRHKIDEYFREYFRYVEQFILFFIFLFNMYWGVLFLAGKRRIKKDYYLDNKKAGSGSNAFFCGIVIVHFFLR